jgi:hypothetical protein
MHFFGFNDSAVLGGSSEAGTAWAAGIGGAGSAGCVIALQCIRDDE